MCISLKTSFSAWIIALISSIVILLINNDQEKKYYIWIAIFILVFSQIQILESLLWMNINNPTNNSKEINSWLTKMILFALWMQPLFNCFVGYSVTKEKQLLYLSILYFGISIYIYFYAQNKTFATIVGQNHHLEWKEINDGKMQPLFANGFLGALYLFGLIYPFFFIKVNYIRNFLIFFAIISFVLVFIFYRNSHDFPSMWCFVAITAGPLFLLINLINKDSNIIKS